MSIDFLIYLQQCSSYSPNPYTITIRANKNVTGCITITLAYLRKFTCLSLHSLLYLFISNLFVFFIQLLYHALLCESRHSLRGLSLIDASELAGAGREMTTLRVKCRQISRIVCKSPQILPKPRIRFILTRATPLWYNILQRL